jgi:hypothetical protein
MVAGSRITARKWHNLAAFRGLLCHFPMPGTDSEPRLLSVRAELISSDRKLRLHQDLRRWVPPVLSRAPAHETSASDRSSDRGTIDRMCHTLIAAFRSRERSSSARGTVGRLCGSIIVAFRSRERSFSARGTIGCVRRLPGTRRRKAPQGRAGMTGDAAPNGVR